jgi:hypothetical protein
MLIPTLTDLHAARVAAAALKERIAALEAPHKAAIAAATGSLRGALRALEVQETALSTTASERYLAECDRRVAILTAGAEVSGIKLPPGCSMRWIPEIVIVSAFELPRAVLVPDRALLKEALAAGPVAGAELTQRPTFQWRESRAKKEPTA